MVCCTCGPLVGLGKLDLRCALAQEMRTGMHLQAANKLPEGPADSYEPLITTAPAVDGGVMRVGWKEGMLV